MSNITKPLIPMLAKKMSTDDIGVAEKGKIGGLDIVVLKRGVIHIFNKEKYPGMLFKKDPDIFLEELNKTDFAKLAVGESIKIEGSGDNDHLILTVVDGEVVPSLEKRKYGVISKLEGFIKKAKELGVSAKAKRK